MHCNEPDIALYPYTRVVSVLAVGWTSLATTEHGVNYCWGRHDAVDFRYPKKTRNFPRPRDILAFGEEVDSGGSVTLGKL